MKSSATLALTLLIVALPGWVRADSRTWNLQDGSTVVAELVNLSRTGEITFRSAGGQTFLIPLSDLRSDDVSFIRSTGGVAILPTESVPNEEVRMFLGFPLGALRGDAMVAARGPLMFGPELEDLTPDQWANQRIWITEIDGPREVWVSRGNHQLGAAAITSLVFRKRRLAQVLVRFEIAPAESEMTNLDEQLRTMLERLYGLLTLVEPAPDEWTEVWEATVGNLHICVARRRFPEDVITLSGSFIPLTSRVTRDENGSPDGQ